MIEYNLLQDPILLILLLLAMAKLFGYLSKKLGQPEMLGEIMAGVLMGPMLLNVVVAGPFLETMAELGIFFLMFIIGLRTELKGLVKVGRTAALVALGGITVPMLLGYLVGTGFGLSPYVSLFLGTTLAITAVAVSGELLSEFNLVTSVSGRTILGAAVVDDILGMVVLSLIISLHAGGGAPFLYTLGITLAMVAVFFIIAFISGYHIIPRLIGSQMDSHDDLRNRKTIFTIIILFTLVLAVAARLAGLHGVIGAFIAGVSIRHALGRGKLESLIYDELSVISFGLMTPFFFIWLGLLISFGAVSQAPLFAVLLIIAAIAGKVVGCGGASYLMTKNPRRSLFIGIGMNGRGAVGLIIAELGRRMGVFNDAVFSAIVLMAFVTTIITPILMKQLIKGTKTKLLVLE